MYKFVAQQFSKGRLFIPLVEVNSTAVYGRPDRMGTFISRMTEAKLVAIKYRRYLHVPTLLLLLYYYY